MGFGGSGAFVAVNAAVHLRRSDGAFITIQGQFAALTSGNSDYSILGRNVRTPAGEVDLVALDGEVVVVVEVKSCRVRRFGEPGRRGDAIKRGRLRGARRWLAARSSLAARPWRYDVVEVDASARPPRVTVRSGAFRERWEPPSAGFPNRT